MGRLPSAPIKVGQRRTEKKHKVHSHYFSINRQTIPFPFSTVVTICKESLKWTKIGSLLFSVFCSKLVPVTATSCYRYKFSHYSYFPLQLHNCSQYGLRSLLVVGCYV